MGDVRRAVAQAMRYAGCLNRRSLGVSDVYPRFTKTRRISRALAVRHPPVRAAGVAPGASFRALAYLVESAMRVESNLDEG